jgi:large subunit ribosomal protein L22
VSYLLSKREGLSEMTSYAKASSIKTSPRKLGIVANSIKGMHVEKALLHLQFCKRKVAYDVSKVLNAAIANAENNDELNVDALYVSEVLIGKSFVLRRHMARAKGRGAPIKKPYSNLTIFVTEREV